MHKKSWDDEGSPKKGYSFGVAKKIGTEPSEGAANTGPGLSRDEGIQRASHRTDTASRASYE